MQRLDIWVGNTKSQLKKPISTRQINPWNISHLDVCSGKPIPEPPKPWRLSSQGCTYSQD